MAVVFCFAHSAWAQTASQTLTSRLRMSDLHLSPKTIQIKWAVPPPPCSAPTGAAPPGSIVSCTGWSFPERTPGSITTTQDNPKIVGNEYVFDDNDWDYNIRYTYSIIVTSTTYRYVAGQNGNPGGWTSTSAQSTDSIYITVRKILASANQTADTRLDPRYGDPTLKNYLFKEGTWRGGLFAGYNADNSNVARTYLKFTGLSGPIQPGEKMWPFGGLALYCTRLASTGMVNLQCRRGLSDTWNENTLNWSNAPLPKATGGPSFFISWDKNSFFGTDNTPPYHPERATGKWIVVNFLPDIQDALADNSTTLTSIVQAVGETSGYNGVPDATPSGGWAYFAKPGYDEVKLVGTPNRGGFGGGPGGGGLGGSPPDRETNLTAFLLYAFGGEGVSYDTNNGGGGGGGGGGDDGGGFEGFSVKPKPQQGPGAAPKSTSKPAPGAKP